MTVRVRLKDRKTYLLWDFGKFNVGRSPEDYDGIIQPYAFVASTRSFDRGLYSIGAFFNRGRSLRNHVR